MKKTWRSRSYGLKICSAFEISFRSGSSSTLAFRFKRSETTTFDEEGALSHVAFLVNFLDVSISPPKFQVDTSTWRSPYDCSLMIRQLPWRESSGLLEEDGKWTIRTLPFKNGSFKLGRVVFQASKILRAFLLSFLQLERSSSTFAAGGRSLLGRVELRESRRLPIGKATATLLAKTSMACLDWSREWLGWRIKEFKTSCWCCYAHNAHTRRFLACQ